MKRVSLLILLAALSFLPTLFFYTVGEEGIYTISSMEMWHSHNWFVQTMYGLDLQRPPLMNWLVMAVANLIGWSHVLIATRLVSVAATLGLAAWLYWLCQKLFADRAFSLFAALTCLLLADLLLYRGWLAYTDPLFAFFTFGAMASLWVGSHEKHHGWLAASVVLVTCAMLTKVFTAYLFYASAGFVLFWQRDHRQFLLSPLSILILASALIVPYFWFAGMAQHGGQSTSMLNEIMVKLSAQSVAGYVRQLLSFPLEIILRLSPAVPLAIYFMLRRRVTTREDAPRQFRNALLIAALCALPYWLSPQSSIRYLMPIYPLIALIGARIIWRTDDRSRAVALRWFVGIMAFKFFFALIAFPYYQTHFRGANYNVVAQAIGRQTEGFPLYAYDLRSVGESVVSKLDIDRFPRPPLLVPPANWDHGFLIAMEPDNNSRIFLKLRVSSDDLYLLCRGPACSTRLILDTRY